MIVTPAPLAARAAPSANAVVLFPTPPLELAITIIIGFLSYDLK
jgi:hypothetical protein